MREALIVCGGLPAEASASDVIELDVSRDAPAYRRIDFDTAKLCAPLVDDLPAVLADALELAAYIYCADRLVTRGGAKAGRGVGDAWARHLVFRIPVRCHDLWQRPEVLSRLVDTLSFLSGDKFTFEFVSTIRPVSLEPHLGFGDRSAQTLRPDTVMLFSGGLDSLAGVAADIIGRGRRAILVTHQSANAIIDLQDRLAEQIGAKTKDRSIFYLPVRLRRGQDQPREHSQRLRSFLFATLALAYARMFGINTVHFYENGITSFNLPVAEHVIGTRASRTTHPQVLAAYGSLFSLLLDESVSFVNPFLWKTKADVVRMIDANGCHDLIRLTTSCAAVRGYSMTRHQCGVCSQCVERRIAMIAAGIEETEEPYGQDMFVGPIEDTSALTMIGGHLLRARRFANMSQPAFLSSYGQAFHAFGSIGTSPTAAAEQTYRLHNRYGEEFVDAVHLALARYATIEGMRRIQGQSLLGMLQTRTPDDRACVDPIESEAPAAVQAAAIPELVPRTIVLAVDCHKKQIAFADGPILKRNSYRIIEALHAHSKAMAETGVKPLDCPHLATRTLLQHLNMKEEALRQNVRRLRVNRRAILTP
jgi:7-cyano-7-deazaguanine synthase in queuosine biosynthesis